MKRHRIPQIGIGPVLMSSLSQRRSAGHVLCSPPLRTRSDQTYDIFEGTEQIQQLVIARAIGGLRIE